MGIRIRKHYEMDEKTNFLDANEQTLMKDNFDKDIAAIKEKLEQANEETGAPIYESIQFPSTYLMGESYLTKEIVEEEVEEEGKKKKKKKEKAPYKGKSEKVYKHMREQIKKQFGFNIQSGRIAPTESYKAKRQKQIKEAAIALYPEAVILNLDMDSGVRHVKRVGRKGKGTAKQYAKQKAVEKELTKKNIDQLKENKSVLRKGGIKIIEVVDPNDENNTIEVMETPMYIKQLEFKTIPDEKIPGKTKRVLAGVTIFKLIEFMDPTREGEFTNFYEFNPALEKKGIVTPDIVYSRNAAYEAVKTTFSNLQNPMIGNALLLPTQEPIYYEIIQERQEEIKERLEKIRPKKTGKFANLDIGALVAQRMASKVAGLTGTKKPNLDKHLKSSLAKSAFKNVVKNVEYTNKVKANEESVKIDGQEITNLSPAEKLLLLQAKGAIEQQKQQKKKTPVESTKKSISTVAQEVNPEKSKYEGRLRGIWRSMDAGQKEAVAAAFGQGDIAMTEQSEEEFVNYYFRYKKNFPTFTLKQYIKKINECY